MARLVLLALILAGAPARGETLTAELRDGRPAVVELAAAVDDAHLANPPGYFPAEPPAARVIERIVVENVGSAPVRDPDVRINGAPLLPVADPLAALGLGEPFDLPALLAAWRDRRVHGTTDLDANRDPRAVLGVFGATFCGDDARALGAITIPRGAEVRFAPLNGHSAGEHRLPGGEWALLDGDQNAIYLRWDNRTPASADDLVADPLLALRTKIYGRQAAWNLATAWQNAARFEHVEAARPRKALRLKRPPEPRHWELLPGERLVIHLDRMPERVHGASDGLRRDAVLRSVACVVELRANAGARNGRVSLPFPALVPEPGEPLFEVAAGEGTIACHAARAQFPLLRAGRNEVVLAGRGALAVSFEWRDPGKKAVPAPVVQKGDGERFSVTAPGAVRLWWQAADERSFRAVPPNFDRAGEFASVADLSAGLNGTFLSPGREYFFRAKVRRDGVWSDWSEPVAFRVRKPDRPEIAGAASKPGGVRLRWKPAAGEMLVFGSDRIDFLPEIFGATEPTRIENGSIRESRPAKNLLAAVPAEDGAVVVPPRAAYRLIARDGGALSVPSGLWRRPGAPAKVLQNRHVKPDGALTGRDVAEEMAVP